MQQSVNRGWKWDHDHIKTTEITKRLGEMICADIQPMSIVEDVGFQWFVEAACPHYQFPSRKHMKNEIIKDSIYGKMVAEMTAHFAKVEFVSCTSDL